MLRPGPTSLVYSYSPLDDRNQFQDGWLQNVFISSPGLSPMLQMFMCNCLLVDISTWISNKPLKLTIVTRSFDFLPFPLPNLLLFQTSLFQLMDLLFTLLLWPKILDSPFLQLTYTIHRNSTEIYSEPSASHHLHCYHLSWPSPHLYFSGLLIAFSSSSCFSPVCFPLSKWSF